MLRTFKVLVRNVLLDNESDGAYFAVYVNHHCNIQNIHNVRLFEGDFKRASLTLLNINSLPHQQHVRYLELIKSWWLKGIKYQQLHMQQLKN